MVTSGTHHHVQCRDERRVTETKPTGNSSGADSYVHRTWDERGCSASPRPARDQPLPLDLQTLRHSSVHSCRFAPEFAERAAGEAAVTDAIVKAFAPDRTSSGGYRFEIE